MAQVFHQHGQAFRKAYCHALSRAQHRVMKAIETCPTAYLGGHALSCESCEHREISYNSCRNRHCPKCQSLARLRWLQDRQAELLPVDYFHVVFTVPEELNLLALRNDRVFYALLFRVSAETLLEVAADPRHLGAQLGVLSVLHTWGQNLMLHPHIHCIIPNGGLSLDSPQVWVQPKRGAFFLPVRVLSTVFRAKFLHALYQAHQANLLVFPAGLAELADSDAFRATLRSLKRKNWVVYAKRPFGGPQQVLDYLGRYTHRVAISNQRLVSVDDQVAFRYKDYRAGGRGGVMKLPGPEFIRRFLTHVLPDGFARIRYFGFLANHQRRKCLARCRASLKVRELPVAAPVSAPKKCCPVCQNVLRQSETMGPLELWQWRQKRGWDSS